MKNEVYYIRGRLFEEPSVTLDFKVHNTNYYQEFPNAPLRALYLHGHTNRALFSKWEDQVTRRQAHFSSRV